LLLFVTVACSTDILPENIALATQKIKPYNVMPVYGKWQCLLLLLLLLLVCGWWEPSIGYFSV